MNITPCEIIKEPCLLKPSGLGADCFTFCDHAKTFLGNYNLIKKPDIEMDEVACYLNNRLREMNKKDQTGQKFLKSCLKEVIKKIDEGKI